MVAWWTKIEQGLFWLLLVTLPWQMRVVLLPVFRKDFFIEYSSTSLYLTDILVIGLLTIWILSVIIKGQKIVLGPRIIFWSMVGLIGWIWIGLCLLQLSGSLMNPLAGLWVAGKITLLGLFYIYLVNRVKNIQEIIVPLSVGIFLQGFIAIGQYALNHSLGLKLLDESILNPLDKGIPVVMKDGMRQLRAHGLTPHANVLGGYLSIGLLLLTTELFHKKNLWLWVSFLVGTVGLFLSFSRAAWLVFLVGIVIISCYGLRHKLINSARLLKGWAVGLALISFLVISQYQAILPRLTADQSIEQNSLVERGQQFEEFKSVYAESGALGVGINQYLSNNIKLIDAKGVNNDYPQPVHNVFLLILAELGILGLIIFVALLIAGLIELCRMRPSVIKVVLILTWIGMIALGLMDHYIWDLQQGRLVFWLVLALIGITGYNERYGRR